MKILYIVDDMPGKLLIASLKNIAENVIGNISVAPPFSGPLAIEDCLKQIESIKKTQSLTLDKYFFLIDAGMPLSNKIINKISDQEKPTFDRKENGILLAIEIATQGFKKENIAIFSHFFEAKEKARERDFIFFSKYEFNLFEVEKWLKKNDQ